MRMNKWRGRVMVNVIAHWTLEMLQKVNYRYEFYIFWSEDGGSDFFFYSHSSLYSIDLICIYLLETFPRPSSIKTFVSYFRTFFFFQFSWSLYVCFFMCKIKNVHIKTDLSRFMINQIIWAQYIQPITV